VDHRIGRLHHRYRLLGVDTPAVAVASRLDRLAAARLPEALDRALTSGLGDDPAVYVLRRVGARFSLRLDAAETDDSLASAWAGRLARAIIRAIADDAGQGGLVRFADRAAYAAAFAADLLAGRARDRWYYAPFAPLFDLPVPDALARLLLDHRDVLPALLARFHREARLARVLVALTPDAHRALWDAARGVEPMPSPDAARPLFALAASLIDRLGLRTISVGQIDTLWHQYLYISQADPDWRDSGSLTLGVLDALRFLLDRTTVSTPTIPTPERLEAALADLDADWLDCALIVRSFPRLLDPRKPTALAGRGPSPTQRLLLDEIRAAIIEVLGSLDRSALDAPANALRILAAVVDRRPDRGGDPSTTALIATLLAAASALARSESPAVAIPTPTPPRSLASLGEPGLEVVATLLARGATSPRLANDPPTIATECAGLFFLIRAVLDLRLAALHRAAEFPDFSTFLAALGQRWSGLSTDDPGIAIFAGLSTRTGPSRTPLADRPPTPALPHKGGGSVSVPLPPCGGGLGWGVPGSTAAIPSTAPDRFQAALIRQVVGLRMIDAAAFMVHVDRRPDGIIRLVAGDPAAGLWPLGRVIVDEADVPSVIAGWSALVDATLGSSPIWTVADEAPGSWTAAVASIEQDLSIRPDVDLTLTLAAVAVIRAWARWLGRFSGSSVGYVLANFLRRPGRIRVDDASIEVEYEPRPLDVVLEMAGYRAAIDAVPWLGGRRVTFRAIER
jgi:hypothetical protein